MWQCSSGQENKPRWQWTLFTKQLTHPVRKPDGHPAWLRCRESAANYNFTSSFSNTIFPNQHNDDNAAFYGDKLSCRVFTLRGQKPGETAHIRHTGRKVGPAITKFAWHWWTAGGPLCWIVCGILASFLCAVMATIFTSLIAPHRKLSARLFNRTERKGRQTDTNEFPWTNPLSTK